MDKTGQMNLFAAENLAESRALLELQWQFRSARVLLTAHQLGVFTALAEPKTATQVAAQCRSDKGMTEKLLIALCALKLVRRQGDIFRLTQLGRDTLLPRSGRYLGGTLDHAESIWWTWTGLPEIVRTGRRDSAPQPPEPFASRWHEHFIWAMHGIAANGAGQWLAEHVDLKGRNLLLDIGGGPGTNSIALCQRFPHLQAVVWDLPPTLNIAEQVIGRFDMKGRITLEAGDWDRDDFGEGYDCLLMSNILHGPDSQAEMKLNKAAAALKPGGLLIVHDFLLDNDKCGPLPAALFNLTVGAYTVAELLAVIGAAGFEKVSAAAFDKRRGSGIVTAIRP